MDKPTINFDLMRTRIEFLFRMIGKMNGRDFQMPIQAINRLTSMLVGDGISIIFIYRKDDLVDLTDEGKRNTDLFAEIVVRHFNNIRHRMMQPSPTLGDQIGNLEIFIREGIDTMMMELKMFFEKLEKASEQKEVSNG
jgi:hypothetical protein